MQYAKRLTTFVLLFTTLPLIALYDIVVYGGTSAGVVSAVQAAKMGKSVVLIEPGQHLGGMTSSGLSWVDIKTSKTIGGLTWEYFHQVWQYYLLDSSWIWETKHPIKGHQYHFHPDESVMWVLEPHVGELIFNTMIAEAKVTVVYNERLNRKSGVQLDLQRIVQITMESGLAFQGKMFIDATYEGDLMAASNVSYIVGREPNSLYHETVNGIHNNNHNRAKNPILIDAFRIKGNAQSGLLPRVYPTAGGNEGDGDKEVQAYNYHMCLTDIVQNRVQVEKPDGYDESQYEILFRAIEANAPSPFFQLDLAPNRKTDSNNRGVVSTDYVGMSWNYAEADYETRKEIALQHELWQRGLIWTLQNHPRVPIEVRAYHAPWGLAKDEFVDNNYWPYTLYMRETRRMISPLVITEQMALGNIPVEDGIGLAYYAIDSHAVKYVVNARGFVETEGGLFKPVANPYPVSYQVIIPSRSECENLTVPVCLSASHAGYGSIRTEPIFMILGQSAATAASLAIDLGVALQDLPYDMLRNQLLLDGQILDWHP